MYRYNNRYTMGPRGRKFGRGGFRPEIIPGILGLMFFGWIILAVIGGLLGAGFMILSSVVSGLARLAPQPHRRAEIGVKRPSCPYMTNNL